VFLPLGAWRPFLAGGNPLNNFGPGRIDYRRTSFRFAAELTGTLAPGFLGQDTRWIVNASFGQYATDTHNRDALTGRLQLALRGLGGPNCNYLTGTPGVGGCQWLNPFSNAIPGNPFTGQANPGYNPAVAVTNELTDWWYVPIDRYRKNTQIEINAGIDGKTGIQLPGGPIRYAVGLQYRRQGAYARYSQFFSTDTAPCADTPINGSTTCFPKPTSAYVFTGSETPMAATQGVIAGYAEVSLPLADTLNVQATARYERYTGRIGSTFNPQVRAKWDITDFLAVRGSWGKTFRAPPIINLEPNTQVSLQNIFGLFIPVDVAGNPNLRPEKSTSWTAGAVLKTGRFRVSVDYWNYNFTDLITDEPTSSVLAAGFGTGTTCIGDPAYIAARFTFSSGCSTATLIKVATSKINGPSIKTSGIDIDADYRTDLFGGELGLGLSATYIDRYSVGTLFVGGVAVPNTAFEAAGKANYGTVAYPLPQWKAQGFIEWGNKTHNLRWSARFTDSYVDQRSGLFAYSAANQTASVAACGGPTTTSAPTVVSPECGTVTGGQQVAAILLHDVTYRVNLPWDVTATLAVTNVFNKDPRFFRAELSYDPLTGDPIGRTFKISFLKTF
jgi:iron complex outermembrane recepter protein